MSERKDRQERAGPTHPSSKLKQRPSGGMDPTSWHTETHAVPAHARAPSHTTRSPLCSPPRALHARATQWPPVERAARPAQQKVPQQQTPHWSWRKRTLCPRPAGTPPSGSEWVKL